MLRFALRGALMAVMMTAAFIAPALAASPAAQRGKAYARAHCARCHAIGRTGNSPFRPALPFRTLHRRYPVDMLGEALAEGIDTGHPAMPEFVLDPDQIHDMLSYLTTLR
ncbi:MAG: c-type cytochrome [Gemmatimonas sp.]